MCAYPTSKIHVYLAHCFDFNRFVGGLRIIFFTLLPFFIVTGAILIAFSFTYRIAFKISNSSELIELERDKDLDSLRYKCIDSYELCLRNTLQAFFSGGDVESWLDIVFGVVAIIIVSLFFVVPNSAYLFIASHSMHPVIVPTISCSMW